MNEKAEQYITLPSVDPPELLRTEIRCECGNPLWVEVITDDQIYLVIGEDRAYEDEQDNGLGCLHYSGWCRRCGARKEWHAPEQKLERMIRRRLKRRTE